MSREELKELGFEEIPHFTVMNNLIYQIRRHRHFSIGCLGEPNEVMFICQKDRDTNDRIIDLVCVHNYDFDGLLTLEKVKALIKLIK
jgi:hypothetical protein